MKKNEVKQEFLNIFIRGKEGREKITIAQALFGDNVERLKDSIFVECCGVLRGMELDPHDDYKGGIFTDTTSLGWAVTNEVMSYAEGNKTEKECMDGIMKIIARFNAELSKKAA